VAWNKFVSIGVKKVIFDAMVKSRLMYGGDIWWASKTLSVDDHLCCKRLEWLGRLTRMGGDRLVGRVWGEECEGKRGRPRVDV
jgi:hypothetical protein